MNVYQVSTTKGNMAIPQAKVPASRGFAYAKRMAEAFAKKEAADGYQILHPDGTLTERVL